MNYAFTFNYLSKFICINLLDYLELRLDFLPFLSYRKNGLLSYKKSLVEANIDVLKIKFGRVQSAISFTTLFVAFLMAFLYKAFFALPLLDGKGADL